MKFSIITPTHRRVNKLTRAVESLLNQSYTDWEIIIVNDSPDDDSYESFVSAINDSRIHYYINDTNRGVNYSRNRALDSVSSDSEWIIFLDDDDYLASDALETFKNLITSHPHMSWFITNRAYKNGTSMTKFPEGNKSYPYAWSYLISKRCKGDATHCIERKITNSVYFSGHVKQGEEWLFFYQIGLRTRMFYYNHNSTLTEGYDTSLGLNFRARTRREQLTTLTKLIREGSTLHLIYHPTFLIYALLRLIRIVIKKTTLR